MTSERAMAERAWQIVHEEELVEAKVHEVEPSKIRVTFYKHFQNDKFLNCIILKFKFFSVTNLLHYL